MSVELALPTSIVPLLGASYGVMRPGPVITRGDTGQVISRDWFEYNIRTYDMDVSVINNTTELEELEAFWHHVRSGGAPFWVKEVGSAKHRWLLCGPLADGSQTSFPLPVVGGSSVTVFDDAVVQTSSNYTIHEAANIISDNEASFETSVTPWGAWSTCSISQFTGVSQSGLASCKVDPTGTVGNVGIQINTGYRFDVDASQEYTAVASIRGSGTFRIALLFYTSGGTSLPSGTPSSDRTWSSGVSCNANEWQQISVTDTSEATAAKCEIVVERTTSSSNDFFIDCVGLVPGDLVRWHLPSLSPGVIEFSAAPAANSRIAATATGYRLCRVRAERRTPAWSFAFGSSVRPSRLSLVEDIEV